MRPGLTASPSSHKAGYPCPAPAGDVRRILLLLWTIFGVLTGGVALEKTGADLVSTTATSDGSVMSTSTWLSGDSIITGRIFGSGLTSINREMETETGSDSNNDSKTGSSPGSQMKGRSTITARSDGTLLIGEYSSVPQESRDKPITCVFVNRTPSRSRAMTETSVSGILQQGNYSYLQTLQPYQSDITVDGRGMIDLRHRLTGNETLSGRTFASGNLSVSEEIRREQGKSP